MSIAFVQQGARLAPGGAGHDDVAALQRAALDQDGGDRAAALVQLGLDDHAFGRTVRVGPQVHDLGLQQDGVDQAVEVDAVLGRHLDDLSVAAQAFRDDFVLQQLVDDLLRVGVRLVDLVDRDDQGRVGGLGVTDGFDRLRHDAVVGGHDQDHDVGDGGAARPHRREGGVARSVEEGDALAVFQTHLIGADVLGDAAGFARGHIRGAQGVQQAGLAVVDVAHDGHDRRTRRGGVLVVGLGDKAGFDVGFRHALDRHAELFGHQFGGVGVDHVVDLHHHALTHQELDDVDAADGHPVGQLLHGDDVGDDHFTRRARLVGGPALALFLLAFAGAADRGQRAHALGGVAVAGDRLDGQAAFAALGFATRAADRLAGVREALVTVVLGTDRTAEAGAGRAAGTGHVRRGRRGVRGRTTAGAGAGRARTGGAGRRFRVQSRIADGLAGGWTSALRTIALGTSALRTVRSLRTVGLRTIAVAHGLFAGRAAAEGGTLDRRTAGRDLGRALAEVDHGTGRRGRTRGRSNRRRGRRGRRRRNDRLRQLDLGQFHLGRGGLGRGGRRRGGRQLGGFGASGVSGGLGGGGFSAGGLGSLLRGGGLIALSGFASDLLGVGGAGAFSLSLGGQGDGAATRLLFLDRQGAAGRAAARRIAARRVGAALIGARTRDVEALRTLMSRRSAGATLRLDDHGLGPSMAEALLHGAGRDRSRRARLQAQRSARPRLRRRVGRGLTVFGLVVFVAHPVALLGAENSAIVSSNTHSRAWSRSLVRKQVLARQKPQALVPGSRPGRPRRRRRGRSGASSLDAEAEIPPVARPQGSNDRLARLAAGRRVSHFPAQGPNSNRPP
ncbi:hypothetical protein D3C80_674900 [compost metagenome]